MNQAFPVTEDERTVEEVDRHIKAANARPARSEQIWFCKIGAHVPPLPNGADAPMRNAVRDAFALLTGTEPKFIFSGWGGELTEPERAVVENRLPSEEYRREWVSKHEAALASADGGHGVQVPQDVAAKLTRAIERVVCSDCPYARGESAVCCMPDAQDALRWLTAPEAPAQASQPTPTVVSAFDAAIAEELPRVSHVEYDSHEICKHFAGEVRKRLLATQPATNEAEQAGEREAFEAWVAKDCGDLTTFGQGQHRHYLNSAVNQSWEAWQARAALQRTEQREPMTPKQIKAASDESCVNDFMSGVRFAEAWHGITKKEGER